MAKRKSDKRPRPTLLPENVIIRAATPQVAAWRAAAERAALSLSDWMRRTLDKASGADK